MNHSMFLFILLFLPVLSDIYILICFAFLQYSHSVAFSFLIFIIFFIAVIIFPPMQMNNFALTSMDLAYLCLNKHFDFQAVDLRSSEVLNPYVKVNERYPKGNNHANLSS